jgi:hypothetical protein
MTNVSKKFILLDTFCERVDGIYMNSPEEMTEVAGCKVWKNLKGLEYGR